MTDLVPYTPGELPDVAAAAAAMSRYQELCDALLEPSDWQQAGDDGRQFVKKSGWTKLAKAYGVSVEFVRETELVYNADGRVIRASARVRATDPTGRSWEAGGACSTAEKRRFSKPDHDLPSTAETRAANRAISNLIGYGQVSAEELDDEQPATVPPAPVEILDLEGEATVARTLQKVWPGVDAYAFIIELNRRMPDGIPKRAGAALRVWAWWQGQPMATGNIRASEAHTSSQAHMRGPDETDEELAERIEREARRQELLDRPGVDWRPPPEQTELPVAGGGAGARESGSPADIPAADDPDRIAF